MTREVRARRQPDQLAKVADQVRLIEVPRVARDRAPVARPRRPADRALQPDPAGELLRSDTDAVEERAAIGCARWSAIGRATAGLGVELVDGDLLDPGSLAAAVAGVDAVVHCAAFFRGATVEQAHAVNDLGTQHLARAACAAGVARFVFTSTGLVYGPNGGRLARETDDCAPIAAYPVSKLAAATATSTSPRPCR